VTGLEARAFLRSADLGGVRQRCRISQRTVASALGVTQNAIWRWENGLGFPRGATAERYARVIAGLQRHLEVTW
jgi:transcriptional regulator with XRE-family HTH domain